MELFNWNLDGSLTVAGVRVTLSMHVRVCLHEWLVLNLFIVYGIHA